MTQFVNQGNMWRPVPDAALHPVPTLPGGNYVVKQDENGNYYLDMVPSFKIPSRLYGDTTHHTDRIINTFKSRPMSTGVLLAGEKGSGKTLLSKNISVALAKEGIPTIIVNEPFCGDDFNTFIQLVSQPCVVLFDEFEKVYEAKKQPCLLTLLDGVFPANKLFILTCNMLQMVDHHMRNRPGRIFYCLDFTGLDEAFIREYCEDCLNEKSHIDRICTIAAIFASFNFDMLAALVEEMNRYNETPEQALSLLNISVRSSEEAEYTVNAFCNGAEVDKRAIRPSTVKLDIFGGTQDIYIYKIEETADKTCRLVQMETELEISQEHFVGYNRNTKQFKYEIDGYTVFLTKIAPPAYRSYLNY